MAKKIQAWASLGPRIELGKPMTKDEIIENLISATNQSRGSVLAVLAELDVQLEAGLKSGRIVQLPNGTHFEPVGKKDGSIEINVRTNPAVTRRVNAEFCGTRINAENIGITQEEIVIKWNGMHPDDQIET